LLRQYWALIMVCVALPLVAITLVTAKQPAQYAASARIITGSIVPTSSAQADAIVSQVAGIATSRNVATHALNAAGANRNLSDFIANHISVTGLGSSQVVDLTVTDGNREVAQKAARALATQVINSLNNVGESGLLQALNDIDTQVVELTQKRAALGLQAASSPRSQTLQAKLAGLDEVIANLTGDRGRLLAQASTQGRAAVIDTPALPAHPQSKALPQKLGLAGLLGLVVGILFAAFAETARPTVPGARRVSRRLGTSLLGRLGLADLHGTSTRALDAIAFRLRLAATHAAVSTVALADVGTHAGIGDLAAALRRALPAAPAVDGVGAAALSGSSAVAGASLSNSQYGQVATDLAATSGTGDTLLKSHYPAVDQVALRIYTLGQMNAAVERGRAGLVVLAGPVARVSDVAAIVDLASSSGWPLLGVVGVPRARRIRGIRRPRREASAGGSAAGRPQ
jgi:uncharacterized protein involved in exopolysaccharide biosynthesis